MAIGNQAIGGAGRQAVRHGASEGARPARPPAMEQQQQQQQSEGVALLLFFDPY